MSRFDIASEPTEAQIAHNYKNVMECIQQAAGEREVLLTAASKSKSPACLKMLYDCGHRHFGENYVQELVEKAAQMPSDVCWHFIGHLQSNKVKELLQGTEGLCVVETVDSEKLATKLDHGCEVYRNGSPLDVFIQINTSGEESKSGTEPGEAALQLAKFIHSSCRHLRLRGLMTIGMPDYTSRPENFECLRNCRQQIAEAIDVPEEALALSMGMSGDFENAIRMGSTNVRVGSNLFGKRFYPPKEA